MKWLTKKKISKRDHTLALNSPSQKKGEVFEHKAANFLRDKGWELLENNFRCKLGEIDLIMKDENTIVFVEVRYRHQKSFGSATESINYHKQVKIINTANYFLTQSNWHNKYPCRFDVVTFEGQQIHWIKNAFSE